MQVVMNFLKKWWIALIMGIIAVILGGVLIANPGTGFEVARTIIVIDFIAVGILAVATVIARRNEIPAWGWDLAAAILLLVLGILVACIPGISEGMLLFFFTFGFLMHGVTGIIEAIALKKQQVKGWGWVLAFGILTAVLGISLVVNPIVAALSIDLLVAFALFSFGIEMIVLAIQMSKVKGAIEIARDSVDKVKKEYAEAGKALEKEPESK